MATASTVAAQARALVDASAVQGYAAHVAGAFELLQGGRPGTAPSPALALCARLEALDDLDRVQAEVVPAWDYGVCEFCQYLDCPANAWLSWSRATTTVQWPLNASHLDGLITGFVLPELGWHRSSVLVQIGDDWAEGES